MKKYLFCLFFFSTALHAQDFALSNTLAHHTENITDVVFSPSGSYFAIGSKDGKISICETQSQKVVKEQYFHNKKITDLQFSKDEKRILSAGYDGFIKVSEWQSGKTISTFQNTKATPYSGVQGIEPTFAVFSADEKSVYFGGYNFELLKGKVGTDDEKVIFNTKNRSINCGALTPKGNYLAFGVSSSVKILDTKTDKIAYELGELDAKGGAVCEMSFSPKNGLLAVWLADGILKFWNVDTKVNTENRKVCSQYGSSCFGFSGDGNFMVTGNEASVAKIWDYQTGNLVQNLTGHSLQTDVMDFSPKNDLILTADKNLVKIWTKKKAEVVETVDKIVFEETELKTDETIDLNLQFPQSKSTLSTDSKNQLEKVVAFMKKYPSIRIKIEGHTDNIGDAAKNMALSTERCLVSKNYLINKGIDQKRVETEGFGGSKPIADNRHESTRKLNRRVEMRILK